MTRQKEITEITLSWTTRRRKNSPYVPKFGRSGANGAAGWNFDLGQAFLLSGIWRGNILLDILVMEKKVRKHGILGSEEMPVLWPR